MDFATARTKMVEEQLKKRGVRDPDVLRAFLTVAREEFVIEHLKPMAYDDNPLPIGRDQTISQPYVVAVMTEYLKIQPGSRVLEIGTGCGYQTAILSKIAKDVFTIERLEALSLGAQKILEQLGFKNIHFRVGDGFLGWPEAAPFDGIIVTAAPHEIPESLVEQLSVGGKMIIPVGPEFGQHLYLVEKTKTGVEKKKLFGVRFVPMLPQ